MHIIIMNRCYKPVANPDLQIRGTWSSKPWDKMGGGGLKKNPFFVPFGLPPQFGLKIGGVLRRHKPVPWICHCKHQLSACSTTLWFFVSILDYIWMCVEVRSQWHSSLVKITGCMCYLKPVFFLLALGNSSREASSRQSRAHGWLASGKWCFKTRWIFSWCSFIYKLSRSWQAKFKTETWRKRRGERDPQNSTHPLRKIVALPFVVFFVTSAWVTVVCLLKEWQTMNGLPFLKVCQAKHGEKGNGVTEPTN